MTNINSNIQVQLPKQCTTNELENLLKNIKEQNNILQNNKFKLNSIEVTNDLKLSINHPPSSQNKGNNPTTVRTELNSLFSSRISDGEQSIDNHFLNFNSKLHNCIQPVQASEFSISKNQIVNELFDSDFHVNNNTLTSENKKKYIDELFNSDNLPSVEDSMRKENNKNTLLSNNDDGIINNINAEEIQINGNEKYIKPEKVINELNEENKIEYTEEVQNEQVIQNDDNENDSKFKPQPSIKLIDMSNNEEINHNFLPQEKEFLPIEVFDFSQRNENNQTISVHIKNNNNHHDNSNIKANESLNSKSQMNQQSQNINNISNKFQHNANIFSNLNMIDILQNTSSKNVNSSNFNDQENENTNEIRKSSEREILPKKESKVVNLTLSNNSIIENNNDNYINKINQEEEIHINSNEIIHQRNLMNENDIIPNKLKEHKSRSTNKNNKNTPNNSFSINKSNEIIEENNPNQINSQNKISDEIKENEDMMFSNGSPIKNKCGSKKMQSLNLSNNNFIHKESLPSGMIIPPKSRNESKEEINSCMFLSTMSKNKADINIQIISSQLPKETTFTEYISKETHIEEQYISNSKQLNRKEILFNNNISFFKYNNDSSFPSFSPLTIYTDIMLTYYFESLNKYSSLFIFVSSDSKISYYNTILSHINEININCLNKTISNKLFDKNDISSLFNNKDLLLNENTFSYWRKISSQEGNSFYISFAYAYIEQLVLSRKINEINALILDIFRLYEFEESVFTNIDIYNAKISMNIIYDFLQCEKYKEVIDFLIMCFNTNNDLVKLLITYIKYCIVIYAIDFEINYIKKEESANYNKQNNINYINNNYAMSNFQNKMILYHNEPCYLMFKLIPFIFNVNLTITYLESTSNQQFQTITFTKNNDNENDVLSIRINLGYFIQSYHILYKEKIVITNDTNNGNNINAEIEPLFYYELYPKKLKCQQCKNKTNFIKHCKLNFFLCSSCLQNTVIFILKQRFVNMYKDNFISKEYYLRPINIKLASTNISISSFDFMNLYKTSFDDYINSFLNKFCHKCNIICDEPFQITKLSCSCQFCENCLLTVTEKVTEGHVIQNIFEKIHNKISKCYCNNKFNLDQAIEALTKTHNDLQEYKDKAKERLKKYALGYCMICKHCFNINNSTFVDVSVDSNIHSQKKYHRVKIISNKKNKGNAIKGIDFIETEHIICNKCFEREVKSNTFSKANKKKNTKKNDDINITTTNQSRTLFCGVCNIEHDLHEYEFEGRVKKSCCGQGCVIL